ncbi:EF-P 5-aminopentanol modification-associated protein YfmF [Jeotgalicoccus sp. S0W5]|uniref:EF-P 5-aminopentanol modification-associated protein YfmF n=1 Tax=Jeotgalicoccus sp. S0W5 TaxID=2527874 RepID=UPI0014152EEA|nr:pitrilysin family protein [Jeotgalicoccus sp. S0W5]
MQGVEKKIINNVPIVKIYTEKFKTVVVSIYFRTPLTEQGATTRSLLSRMMVKRTSEHPTNAKLLEYLAEHYGAHLTSNVIKKGSDHLLKVSIEFVNDKFILEDMDMLGDITALLKDVLYSPFSYSEEDQAFFDREKRLLKNRLTSMKDNYAQRAFESLLETMFDDEPYRILSFGDIEVLEQLTLDDVKAAHADMMANNDMSILVAGKVDDKVFDALANVHQLEEPKLYPYKGYPIQAPGDVKYKTTESRIEQAKANLGFRVLYSEPGDVMALNVFNQLFGGSASSLLFTNIREKMSLAYSIHSQVDIKNGYLFVLAGVDNDNIKVFEDAVKRELDRVLDGDFDERFVEEIKRNMLSSRKESMDKPRGLISLNYNRLLRDQSTTKEVKEWTEQLKAVTKADIINLATKIKLDTVYTLKGGNNDD